LAWVALVPFILVCSADAKPKVLVIAAYVISFLYWLGNLYWLCPVTWIGWVAFCLYTGILWPLLALCVRYCRIKKIPLFLAVPVLAVGAERLQGLFLGGFFWRFLAHSQYANITLIQIADVFGAAGVSFVVAMVNGLIAELIIAASRKNIFRVGNFIKVAVTCAIVVAVIFYGRWRIVQSGEFLERGPMVAAVQTNVPQSVKESFGAEDKIFDELFGDGAAAAKGGAELVVWPETMVLATLDKRVLSRLTLSYHCKIVDEKLREYSKENNIFVLAGAYGGVLGMKEDLTFDLVERYNSAFLYTPEGTAASEQYNKIHIVPFGEIVPFKKSFPLLHTLLMKFTPYDYDYSLDYGTEYTVFEMKGKAEQKRVYRFGVMICYEDSIPQIARRFAADERGQKKVDWLVNISNDGWFVKFRDGDVFPSAELSQHTAVCVFRAVENRLAVVRSVNTGISCLIDTAGRIKDGFQAGTLPQRAMSRMAVGGWFADRVPIDKRTTFFSIYGQWPDICCAGCFVGLLLIQLFERSGRNKRYGKA
jgi:apolipoprotein N-acyltransferase